MIRVGIECEQIEGEKWGVGTSLFKFLEEVSQQPNLANYYEFRLYFKSKIPDIPFLKNKIFTKKLVRVPVLSRVLDRLAPASFSLYFYIMLPIRLWFERCDVVFFPNNMLPILFRGKSIVVINPDLHYETYHGSLPFRYRLAYRVFGNWAAHHGTAIMTFSETARGEVAKLYNISEHRIISNYHGIDIGGQEGNIPEGEYIMYLGQAFPRRHLKEIMLAFERIAPEFPELRLLAFGYDKYNPAIIQELTKSINTRLGREAIKHENYAPQDSKAKLLQNARVFTYISKYEAFGIPQLEALACGTVPVVADTPMTREIMGNCAYFVEDVNSIDAIADTLRTALINKEETLRKIEKGKELIASYTWSAHTERFLKIVDHITHG